MADVIYTVRRGGNDYEIQGREGLTLEDLTRQIEAQTRIPSRFAPPYSEEQARLLQADRAAQQAPVAPRSSPTDQELLAYSPSNMMMRMARNLPAVVRNIPSSALGVAEGFVTPILHPVQTFNTMVDLGGGVLSKLGVKDYDEKTADAVGQFFVDRYGSPANIEKTLVEDPVGAALDVSSVFTAGGTLAARMPGMLGRVGRASRTIGNLTDPITLATQALRAAVATPVGRYATAPFRALWPVAESVAFSPITSMTGVGRADIQRAATTSAKLGQAVERHLRGEAPIDEPLIAARGALGEIRKARGEEYRTNIAPATSDPTGLDISKLDEVMGGLYGRGDYRGINVNPPAEKVWQDIYAKINEFKDLGDAGRTVEALDRLKQAIYNIGKGYEYGTPERSVATEAGRAVRDVIGKQAEDYAKVMSDYELMSDTIDELERALSLGDRASVDTSLRKLQSATRNNANTNFGYRETLLDLLGKYGAEEVPYMLAGQSLSALEPRGLPAQLIRGGAGLGGPIAALAAGDLSSLVTLGLFGVTPRAVGEAARVYGKAAGPVSRFAGEYGPALVRGGAELGIQMESLRDAALAELQDRYSGEQDTGPVNPFDGISDADLELIISNPGAFLPQEETTEEAQPPAEEQTEDTFGLAPGPGMELP